MISKQWLATLRHVTLVAVVQLHIAQPNNFLSRFGCGTVDTGPDKETIFHQPLCMESK